MAPGVKTAYPCNGMFIQATLVLQSYHCLMIDHTGTVLVIFGDAVKNKQLFIGLYDLKSKSKHNEI